MAAANFCSPYTQCVTRTKSCQAQKKQRLPFGDFEKCLTEKKGKVMRANIFLLAKRIDQANIYLFFFFFNYLKISISRLLLVLRRVHGKTRYKAYVVVCFSFRLDVFFFWYSCTSVPKYLSLSLRHLSASPCSSPSPPPRPTLFLL